MHEHDKEVIGSPSTGPERTGKGPHDRRRHQHPPPPRRPLQQREDPQRLPRQRTSRIRRDRQRHHHGERQEAARPREAQGLPQPQLRRGRLLGRVEARRHGRGRRRLRHHARPRVAGVAGPRDLQGGQRQRRRDREEVERPPLRDRVRSAVGRQGEHLRARARRRRPRGGRRAARLPLRPALPRRPGVRAVPQGHREARHPRDRAPHAAARRVQVGARLHQPASRVRPHHRPGDGRRPRAVQRHVRPHARAPLHPHRCSAATGSPTPSC